METYDSGSCVILTGTPVQNNLGEMYSLLSFVHPDQFKLSAKDDFLVTYKNIKTDARGNRISFIINLWRFIHTGSSASMIISRLQHPGLIPAYLSDYVWSH